MSKIKSYCPENSHWHISIVPHCPMNCKHCIAVSPLAKPEFATFEQFNTSIQFIKSFQELDAPFITLTGGDCFLHPHLDEFAIITRKAFPNSYVRIACNGLHLDEMTPERWQIYKDNNISIKVRPYSFENFYHWWKAGKDNGVDVHNFDHPIELEMSFIEFKARTKRNYCGKEKFENCRSFNYCVIIDACTLRYYKCDRMYGLRHLGKEWEDKLIESKDYYDISNPATLDYDKIKDVFALPFCEYCGAKGQWRQSHWTNKGQRKSEEWIDDSEVYVSKKGLWQ